jgi:hypothetical protein
MTEVDIDVIKIGSPTGNFYAYVFSNNTTPEPDEPNAQVGTGSDAYDISTVSSTRETVRLTGMSVPIVDTTEYWLVLYKATINTTNYMDWYRNSGFLNTYYQGSDAGSTWTGKGSRRMRFKTYSADPDTGYDMKGRYLLEARSDGTIG